MTTGELETSEDKNLKTLGNKLFNELYTYRMKIPGGFMYYYREIANHNLSKILDENPTPAFEVNLYNLSQNLKNDLVILQKSNIEYFERVVLNGVAHLFEIIDVSEYDNIIPILKVKFISKSKNKNNETAKSLIGEYGGKGGFEKIEFESVVNNNEDETTNKHNRTNATKGTAYWEIDDNIKSELANYDLYLYNLEPAKFYISNTETNQICRGYVGKEADVDDDGKPEVGDDGKTKFHMKLRFSMPLIDAIPIKVIKYNNGLNTDKKYKVTFMTNTNETFTSQINTIEDMMVELRGRGLVAVTPSMAEVALRGILNGMETNGKVEVTNEAEQPGFYLSPDKNKIECYGLEFKTPTDEDIKETCDFINEVVESYRRKDKDGKIVNDRRVFPVTVLKWGINAPFDWIMKEYDKWLPWLHLGGWYSTAKNTLAKWGGLSLWRVHAKTGHVISFKAANTDYRLGQVISQTTLPVLINEVKELNTDRYGGLVEWIKQIIDEKNARGKYHKTGFIHIPSLSAAMLTGNGVPPRDGAYRSKCRCIIFTSEDMFDRESDEAKKFRDWMKSKIHLMGTLGDFTAQYIMNKPEILKEKEWNDIAIEVLSEFYIKAGLDIPEWINFILEYHETEQTKDEAGLMLRSYFINLINDTTNRYRPPLVRGESRIESTDYFDNESAGYMSPTQRLEACSRRGLIPFIQYDDKNKRFYITYDIMEDLKKYKLSDLVSSHKGLAALLGFEYKNVKIGANNKQAKVIIADIDEMKEFLEYKIGDVVEEQTEEPTSNEDNKDTGKDEDMKDRDNTKPPTPTPRSSKKKK